MNLRDGVNKAALVTGASKGIGYACAERLQRDGFSLIVCSRHEDEILAASERLHASGDVVGVRADVGEPHDCARIVQTCIDEYGRIDAVVNNAGIYIEVPFLELDGEKWDQTLDVNVRGPALISVAAARHMRKQGGGRIVHISSVNGLAGEPQFAHYNASKAALISLTQTMAVDLAQHNIQVNCIAPGWILTPLSEPWTRDLDEERLTRLNPMKRVGKPEEIAEVAAFLCRAETTFLTGETITVDGGQMAMLAMP